MTHRRPARLALVAFASVLALAGCDGQGDAAKGTAADGKAAANAAPGIPAPAGKRWSETVAKTPDGGFRMGNPDAPVRLIEYASLTCGACQQFAEQSAGKLEGEFVDTGRVSYELRPYTRNAVDLTASALTQCAGPERVFPLTHATFAGFEELMTGAQAGQAQAEAAAALPPAQRIPALAKAFGVPAFFQARGMTQAQIDSCLADTAAIEALADVTTKGNERFDIAGTPTFILNDSKLDATSWDAVAAELRKATAG